jgi:hypothetical protein
VPSAEILSRAGDQLSSSLPDGQCELPARIAAIYALEELARGSPESHWQVMEILTAYVRVNSPVSDVPSGAPANSTPLRTDIQTALAVVGRRDCERETWVEQLDLHATDLHGACLIRAHLERSDLAESNLANADLIEAALVEADLRDTCLGGADLTDADLRMADLRRANFGSPGSPWHTVPACLTDAVLDDADLRGVDLRNTTGLRWEQIDVATVDAGTQLPQGLQYQLERLFREIAANVDD